MSIMIRDEYNHVEVTNDKQTFGKEFGKTQKTEFSFQRENKIPEGDLNEKYVGKTVKKVTEVNVEYTNKVPTHGTTTVVKGATTAANVASATSSVVVVASTVTVAAVAVAIGVSVALNDYQFKLDSILISSTEIAYALTINDNKTSSSSSDLEQYENPKELNPRRIDDDYETKKPFSLRVYNNNYDSTQNLSYGYNKGIFTDLTLGDSYNIVLAENKNGGEIVFSETFTTYKNSVLRDFYLDGSYDSLKNTFDVYLDYVDELEVFDDFVITLTDIEDDGYTYTFPLEPVSGTQKIDVLNASLTSSFDFSKAYNYVFSYKNNGDVIDFDEGQVSFYDTSAAISKVRGVEWDKTADFVNKVFYVSLDFQDDFDYFSQFEITLQDKEYPDEVTETFALEKKTGSQPVYITRDSSINFRREYYYMFTYQDSNTGMQEIIESGEVKFVDNSGGEKYFNSVIIDPNPHYDDGTFGVKLDYVDNYEELMSFHLSIYSPSSSDDVRDIYLTETNKEQFVNASDYRIDFNETYLYSFDYYDAELDQVISVVEDGILEFDNSNAVVEFNNLIFDKKANYQNRSFDVQLDFQDDLNVFTDFEFIITDQDTGETQEFTLSHTTDTQTLFCDDITSYDGDEPIYRIDIVKNLLSYSFRYFDKRINDYVVIESGEEFRFENSVPSVFSGIESPFDFTPESGSSDSYLLPIKFNYDNAGGAFSGFTVRFRKDSLDAGELRFEGETLTEDWQYGVYIPGGEYGLDDILGDTGVEIVVIAYQNDVDYPILEPEREVYSKVVTLTKDKITDVHSAEIVDEYIHNGGEINLQVVYSGISDNIDAKLILEGYSGKKYIFNIMLNGPSYSYVLLTETDDGEVISDEEFEEDFLNHPMKVILNYSIYTYSGSGVSGDDGTWSDPKTIVLYDSYQFYLSV